jgi:hypothetical protein
MYLDINILNSFVKHYFVVCLEKVDIFIHASRLDWFVKNNKFLAFLCVCACGDSLEIQRKWNQSTVCEAQQNGQSDKEETSTSK